MEDDLKETLAQIEGKLDIIIDKFVSSINEEWMSLVETVRALESRVKALEDKAED